MKGSAGSFSMLTLVISGAPRINSWNSDQAETTFMKTMRIIWCLIYVQAATATNGHAQSPTRPQRIISVSPVLTEILYGIGAFDRVVAVSDYCTYPPAVENLPRVGGWENSNLEKIAALRPDLVILTDAQAPFLEDKLRDLGIRSVAVPTRSLADIFVSIDEIGRATGTQARAADLARRTRASLDNTRALTRNLPRP